MYSYFTAIDEHVYAGIYEYEEQQLLKFKSEFDSLCLSISKMHGWHCVINIYRWTDFTYRCVNKLYDGYTATLQIDILDNNDNVVEWDESICSFFENITYISFNPFKRKYKVIQNEDLAEIRTEIKQFICSLENS